MFQWITSVNKYILNREEQEERGLRRATIDLSDLFALKEGRRPRLLIAYLDVFQEKKLHEMAAYFADLGCNVDIAPFNSNLTDVQKQCLENDTDLLLLFADESSQKEEFYEFLTNIFSEIPHIVPAIVTTDSKSTIDTRKDYTSWSFFDQNDRSIILASTLMKKLVSVN